MFSSLNTLGYIEFDDLCNLNVLDDKLSIKYDMPCFSGKTFHVIGKYNGKGDYLVHRVYICSDHNVPCNKNEQCELDGRIFINLNFSVSFSSISTLQRSFKKGEQRSLPWVVKKLKPRTVSKQEGEDDVTMASKYT